MKHKKQIEGRGLSSPEAYWYTDHDGTPRRVRKTDEPTMHFNAVEYVTVRSLDDVFSGIVLRVALQLA